MNTEIKQEWIARLLSGKYPQGLLQLRSLAGRFCCMGVLCEIGVEHGIVQRTGETTYGGEQFALPAQVAVWAGLEDDYGIFSVQVWQDGEEDRLTGVWDLHSTGHVFVNGESNLAKLNDEGIPFRQIADVIDWAF